MTRQGCSHGWAWEGIGPPTWEPDPANQNEFFPTKGLYYRQKFLLFSKEKILTNRDVNKFVHKI